LIERETPAGPYRLTSGWLSESILRQLSQLSQPSGSLRRQLSVLANCAAVSRFPTPAGPDPTRRQGVLQLGNDRLVADNVFV
jgi:hypothetical protein